MKAVDRAMRLLKRLPRAAGGGTLDDSDAVPALMQDAIATAPAQAAPQRNLGGIRGGLAGDRPLVEIPYRADFIPAQGKAPEEPINYVEDEYGTPHQVPAGTEGARQAAPGMSLQDGSFYNESAPVGLAGKTTAFLTDVFKARPTSTWAPRGQGVPSPAAPIENPNDTPGGARAATSWTDAAYNTMAGLSPGYLVDSLQRTVQLPGEVYQGKVAPNDVMRNLEFVANVGAGGGAFAETGAAGIFGGRLAATADHAALAKAEQMAAKGADPYTIYRDTGWFQGPDQKWRFEINDQKARVTAPTDIPKGVVNVGKASDAFEHPELYAAYPELANTPIVYGDLDKATNPGMRAGYSPENNFFILNTEAIKRPGDPNRPPPSAVSSLLHEHQHGVQGIEDFAPGTSPSRLMDDPNGQQYVSRVLNERREVAQSQVDDAQFAYDFDPSPENKALLMQARRNFYSTMRHDGSAEMEAYLRAAGEVEARNVQKRQSMSPELRREIPPWDTEDVAPQKQFDMPPSGPPVNPFNEDQLAKAFMPKGRLATTAFANANQEATQALGAVARSREIDPMGFYSPSLEASKAIPQQVGTVAQMKSMLLKNGAKPKELEAVGFDKAFPDPNAKVNRQDIETYLRDNRVRLGRTNYGDFNQSFDANNKYALPEVVRAARSSGDTPGDLLLTLENDGNAYRALMDKFPELRDREDWADVVANSIFGGADRPADAGKFQQYSTPGGTNYRENILTLPNNRDIQLKQLEAERQAILKEYGANGSGPENFSAAYSQAARDPRYIENLQKNDALHSGPNDVYGSSHWPGVDNPLIHYRTQDFPGGTRVLEEMQSDWAQRGRDQGFKNPESIKQLESDYQQLVIEKENIIDSMQRAITPDMRAMVAEKFRDNPLYAANYLISSPGIPQGIKDAVKPYHDAFMNTADKERDLLNKLRTANSGVPSAPFTNSTSDWTDLGIKSAMIDAARNPDVNRMAWTPGSVQNQRYGLEHHVNSIDVLPPVAQGGNGRLVVKMKNGQTVPMTFAPDGTVQSVHAEINGKPLADVVGADVAQKIMSKTTPTSIRGVDLSIGGEGMRGYYDKIMPNRIQEVMKKQGLGKPEFRNAILEQEADLNPYTGAMSNAPFANYPSFQMTPEMRQKILSEGLSLFNKGDPYASAVLGAISRSAEEGGVGREIGTQAAKGHGSPEAGISGRGELSGSPGGVSPSGGAENPYARIPGIPETAKIPGYGEVETKPIPWVVDAANDYSKKSGVQHKLPEAFGPLDEARAKRIAEAFEAMEHDPTNPEVRRAYEAMADETLAQYRALKDQGAKFYFNNGVDPYAKSPAMGYPELRDQRSLSIFPTDEGFGTGADAAQALENNPLLKKTGEKFGDREATVNDLFRAVHDSFGHFGFGNAFFRAPGEERAWMLHSGMYGPEARKAMTTETRGQNSWLNSGPHAEHNKTASGADTVFAPQKTGLLPDWVANEGAEGIGREQYDAIQRALRLSGKRLFSNADDQMSLPLAGMAREGAEQKTAGQQATKTPKEPKPIVPRDLDPSDQGFYSQQVEALKGQIQMKQGNAQQWRNALKKAGVKDEELKWTGMNDYLDQLEKTGHKQIPRDQLLNYAEENKVIPGAERYVDESGNGSGRGYSDDDVWNKASEYAQESEYESNLERLAVDLDADYMNDFKNGYSIEADTSQVDLLDPGKSEYVVRDGATKDNDIIARFATEKEAEDHLDKMAREAAKENEKYAVYDDDGQHIRSFDSEWEADRGLDRIASEWASDADPEDWGDIDYWREHLDMPPESESRTMGYLSDRPKGGTEYTERVLDTPGHALRQQGSEGFGDTHIDWPQDHIPGWLLTEKYKDALSGGNVHHVHEAQSDWSQKAIDQGFKSQDQAAIDAALDALTEANNEYQKTHQTLPYVRKSLDDSGGPETYYPMNSHQRYDAESLVRNIGRAQAGFHSEQRYVQNSYDRIKDLNSKITHYKEIMNDPNSSENHDYAARHLQTLTGYLKNEEGKLQSNLRDMELAKEALQRAREIYDTHFKEYQEIPADQAKALIEAHSANYLRRSEAQSKLDSLRNGVNPGPWINDVPEVTKLLMKRGLIDAANEGADYFSWSSPEMVASRWGERGYTEPLYGKMIPNTALKLAKEHDPNAKVESVFLGNRKADVPEPMGSFDMGAYNPNLHGPDVLSPEMSEVTRAKGVDDIGSSFRHPIKDIVYGPSGYREGGGRYMLEDETGNVHPHAFATREGAERAMEQINKSLAQAKENGVTDPAEYLRNNGRKRSEALGIKITPQMRESIKKRGFSAFLNRDPAVASILAGAAKSKEDDLPDYVEPAAKRRIKDVRH